METPETPPQEESKNVVDSIFSDNTTDLENEEPTEAEEAEEPVDVIWKRIDDQDKLAILQSKLDLMSNQQHSLKGIVKTRTSKMTTIEKTVKQFKEDADTEFKSIYTKQNQLEHSTETRVAAVETAVAEQTKRLDEEFAFANRRYEKLTERVDDNQIKITHIEDGTTDLPDSRAQASDELKTAFKDAIVEAVTKLHATGIIGSTPTQTGMTIPGQPPPATTTVTTTTAGTTTGTQPTEAAAIQGACHLFPNATNDSMPATVTHDFSTEKRLQQIITTQCLDRHVTPEYGISQVFLRSSSPVHISALLHYTQDGHCIMQQAYNVAYESMIDQAPNYFPDFFKIQPDGHKYLIVNRNQILTIGSDGRQTLRPNSKP